MRLCNRKIINVGNSAATLYIDRSASKKNKFQYTNTHVLF